MIMKSQVVLSVRSRESIRLACTWVTSAARPGLWGRSNNDRIGSLADAYGTYDQDGEHNRGRTGLLSMTEQIARVQFEMP
jgi:hypothetical protein